MRTKTTPLMRFVGPSMFQEQRSIATSRLKLHRKKTPQTFSLYHILSKEYCNGFVANDKNTQREGQYITKRRRVSLLRARGKRSQGKLIKNQRVDFLGFAH